MGVPFLNGIYKGKETVPLVFCEEKRNIIQRGSPVKNIIMMSYDLVPVFSILSTKPIDFLKFKVDL
jgi:hypothetical protein